MKIDINNTPTKFAKISKESKFLLVVNFICKNSITTPKIIEKIIDN
tara:strand:+ start:3206 stop:3343 length:138 start_codon:yes stop_codon:yes gene_type:complete